jgi:hypothetical protein
LPWDKNCLSPHKNNQNVKTASQHQVRKKIYRGSSEKWKRFEPFLEDTIKALQTNDHILKRKIKEVGLKSLQKHKGNLPDENEI